MSQENGKVKNIIFRGGYIPIYPDAMSGYRFLPAGYNKSAREEYLEWEKENGKNVSVRDMTTLPNGDISIEYIDVG